VQGSRIASYYGARRSFNGGILHTYHGGTDLVAPVGTPVYAAAPGRVAAVQDFKVRGTAIIIDHGRGVFTVYCHLSSTKVNVGDVVDAGQMIAYSGNTGRSEGPHLHWELAVGGVTVDVLPWTQQPLP
jgi:murein DD-endopeptidase MepM/ murein hydrolase activator NlpD